MSIYDLMNAATGLFEAIAVSMIYDKFLGKLENIRRSAYFSGAAAVALVIAMSNYIFKDTGWNMMVMMSAILAFSFMYDSGIKKKVFFAVISYAIMLATEMAVMFIMVVVKDTTVSVMLNDGNDKLIGEVISKILLFAAVVFISRRGSSREAMIKTSYYTVLLVSVMAGVVALCLLYALNSSNESRLLINLSVICSVGVLFCLFLTLWLYSYLSREYSRINRENLLNQQLEAQKRYTAEILAQQEQLRRVRHDIENHMIAIKSYLKTGDSENGIKYIDNLIRQSKIDVTAVNTGNSVIDAVVTSKRAAAERYGIDFSVRMQIPAGLAIEPSDCCIVLGNILDNAVEACRKAEGKKVIEFSLIYDKPVLICKVRNTMSGEVNKDLKTTKSDADNHGIGLDNVKNVLGKYKYIFSISHENGMFSLMFELFGI